MCTGLVLHKAPRARAMERYFASIFPLTSLSTLYSKFAMRSKVAPFASSCLGGVTIATFPHTDNPKLTVSHT